MNKDKLQNKHELNITALNRAITSNYEASRQQIEDMLFAKVAGEQWSGSDAKQWDNKPKPENNKVAKHINRLRGQLDRQELSAVISASSTEATEDDAKLLQSRFRNDFNMSDGVEAQQVAVDEAYTCGFGAIKLVAVYEDDENPNPDLQNISFEPIYSACSSVLFNAGAIRKDKQDAKRAWQIMRVDKIDTEEDYDTNIVSVPNQGGAFGWDAGANNDIYIAHSYEMIERSVREYIFDDGYVITVDGRARRDSLGDTVSKDDLDDLLQFNNYETVRRKVRFCEYSLISGDQYLIEPTRTPFKTIPIIPQYGYHNIINGVEHVCGEVARQRDLQRFENQSMGALMELLTESQKTIPEYLPEQIERHAAERANKNLNNPAVLMSDPIYDTNGILVKAGPIGMHQPSPVGSGLSTALQWTASAQNEMAGTGQATIPSSVSGAAVQQVNERQDDAFNPLIQNAIQARKALCSCYIPAAQELYYTNSRLIRVQALDGSSSEVETLQNIEKDGVYGPFKNSARGRYDVSIKAGESHKTLKEAERASAAEILKYTTSDTKEGRMAVLMAMQSTTGETTQIIRTMARRESIKLSVMDGIDPKAENDEEKQYIEQLIQQIQEAQQGEPNDPQAALVNAEAEARLKEGQAALLNEQNDAMSNKIAMFKAETDRINVQIKAQELGIKLQDSNANIELKDAQASNQRIDAIVKVQKGSSKEGVADMGNEALLRRVGG